MKNIGIPTGIYGDTFGIHKLYVNWVAQFGRPVLLTPYDIYWQKKVDAVFLPGGADVIKGQTYLTDRSNPHLEWFDKEVLPAITHSSLPVFGVCRGMQAINMHFGGTLRNLIGEELKKHQKNATEDEKNSTAHDVEIKDKRFQNEDNPDFYANFENVNSIHHQVVDKLAYNFTTIAEDDGIIEAIIHKDLKVAGVNIVRS